eukprot:gene12416-8519_t
MIEEMALEQLLCEEDYVKPSIEHYMHSTAHTHTHTHCRKPSRDSPRSHKKSAPIRLYPSHLSMRRLSVSLYREIQTIIIGTPTNTTQLPPPKK